MTPADIRVFRARNDLSQEALAGALGLVKSTVNRWEKGHAPIPLMLTYALPELERRLESGEVLVPVNDKRGRPRKEPQG